MKQKICKDLNFSDCEMAILRMTVDKAEEKMGKRIANSEDIQKIINHVEDFLKTEDLICYGGTAINNILPEEDKFYNKDVEIPDYDFFSYDALENAKKLANIYYKKGFTEVEAKAGQHHGTYKVYVNFIPVADITQIPKEIFKALKKDSIRVAGILYASPNFLRMSMYLELSRPAGDISRWEKVLKRLSLLNKHYPLTTLNCDEVEFQRRMTNKENEDQIYENVKNTFINQGVVFFGGFAISLYSQYMPRILQKRLQRIADFDVLSHDPETTAQIVKERLKDIGVTNCKVIKHDPAGEILPEHYEIKVGKDTIAFIYKPIACHSYNVLFLKGQKVKIATIDTMLSFYLAFLYADRPYYDKDRILCMSKYLFEVQAKNRLSQKGVLRRFSINCMGHQETIEEMRAEKAEKFKELKNKKGTAEYDSWFLRYRPADTKKDKEGKDEESSAESSSKSSSSKQKTKSKRKRGKKTKKRKGFFGF